MVKRQKRWTANDVYHMLEKAFPPPAYAMLSQLRNGTGFVRAKNRTADAVAISCYPSRGLYMTGIKIKVARSDWLKELADPTKAEAIQKYCKYWFVAAPKGLIEFGEVPETWGLIECDSSARVIKPAPVLTPEPPDMLLTCSILRNASTSMVPLAMVRKKIDAAVDEHLKCEQKFRDRELERLQKTVRTFEESSGVEISDTWDAKGIGKAVEIVREMGCEKAMIETRRLRDQHTKLAERLTKMIESTVVERVTPTENLK